MATVCACAMMTSNRSFTLLSPCDPVPIPTHGILWKRNLLFIAPSAVPGKGGNFKTEREIRNPGTHNLVCSSLGWAAPQDCVDIFLPAFFHVISLVISFRIVASHLLHQSYLSSSFLQRELSSKVWAVCQVKSKLT